MTLTKSWEIENVRKGKSMLQFFFSKHNHYPVSIYNADKQNDNFSHCNRTHQEPAPEPSVPHLDHFILILCPLSLLLTSHSNDQQTPQWPSICNYNGILQWLAIAHNFINKPVDNVQVLLTYCPTPAAQLLQHLGRRRQCDRKIGIWKWNRRQNDLQIWNVRFKQSTF